MTVKIEAIIVLKHLRLLSTSLFFAVSFLYQQEARVVEKPCII